MKRKKVSNEEIIKKQREIIVLQNYVIKDFKEVADYAIEAYRKSTTKLMKEWRKEIRLHKVFSNLGMVKGGLFTIIIFLLIRWLIFLG